MSASSSLDNPPASIWHIKYEAGTTGDMLSGSDGDTFATGITDWYPRVRPDQYFDLDAVCPANEWSDKLLVQTQPPVVYHQVKLEIDHCSTPAKRALSDLSEPAVDYRATKVHKVHKGRGIEQKYICGYCKRIKKSTSFCSDGRVRIRCECGGQHLDGRSRMHATWTAVERTQTGHDESPRSSTNLSPNPSHREIVFVDESSFQGKKPVSPKPRKSKKLSLSAS